MNIPIIKYDIVFEFRMSFRHHQETDLRHGTFANMVDVSCNYYEQMPTLDVKNLWKILLGFFIGLDVGLLSILWLNAESTLLKMCSVLR